MQPGRKARLKRLALEIRGEFGIDERSRFDPYAYFAEYGIRVVMLSTLDGPAKDHFFREFGSPFSGALIPNGTGFVVLDNDAHDIARRRSTAAHEVAHHALEHEFAAAIPVDGRHCGLGGEQEKEAEELSGELLIPTASAQAHALARWPDEAVGRRYDVSIDFARWRMNVSGARKKADNVHRRRSVGIKPGRAS